MGNGFGVEFEDDGEAESLGLGGGFVFGLGEERGHGRDAVELEDFFGLEFGEKRPAGRRDGVDQLAGFFFAAAEDGGIVGGKRRFVEAAEIVGVVPHGLEGAGGGIGIGEGGDAGGVEDADAGFDGGTAHPTGEDGFAMDFGVGFQFFGDLGGVGHALGGENGEEAIGIGIVDGDFGGAGVTLRVGVAEDVDGIGVAPVRWEESVESAMRGFRKRSELAADALSKCRWRGRQDRRRW